MVALINTQINNQQDKQLIQIRVKSVEAVRSSLLRIDPDRLQNGDIANAFNLIKSKGFESLSVFFNASFK